MEALVVFHSIPPSSELKDYSFRMWSVISHASKFRQTIARQIVVGVFVATIISLSLICLSIHQLFRFLENSNWRLVAHSRKWAVSVGRLNERRRTYEQRHGQTNTGREACQKHVPTRQAKLAGGTACGERDLKEKKKAQTLITTPRSADCLSKQSPTGLGTHRPTHIRLPPFWPMTVPWLEQRKQKVCKRFWQKRRRQCWKQRQLEKRNEFIVFWRPRPVSSKFIISARLGPISKPTQKIDNCPGNIWGWIDESPTDTTTVMLLWKGVVRQYTSERTAIRFV